MLKFVEIFLFAVVVAKWGQNGKTFFVFLKVALCTPKDKLYVKKMKLKKNIHF